MRRLFLAVGATLVVAAALLTWWHLAFAWLLVPLVVLFGVGLRDMLQREHSILRNFPLAGHLRFLFEAISPEIQQYFIERHTDGVPISRNHRALVYQRAKDLDPTHPFGTELDLYDKGYEGLRHSMYPVQALEQEPRVTIGAGRCTQPYEASMLNISAMSYGALSGRAIEALSHGARAGGFYLNTGEGSLTEHHLVGECDVVWQIGTGYFGCRDDQGRFDRDAFVERARRPEVKMIEIKLSQGAKPGHGGVLPAIKNTEEIARVRLVEPHRTVLSPPGHSAFQGPRGLLEFVASLRELSGGKPVGFKLCIGREDEFRALCEAMVETDLLPDFITVDGAEGGTGAAPLEFTDSVGMPMRPALQLVHRTLQEFDLRERLVLIASGKLLTAASLVRALALGADVCNSARAFMLSLGCIQALRCDKNTCPTGVATQDPELVKGLSVADKRLRVERFHRNTVRATLDLIAACGVSDPAQVTTDIFLDAESWADLGNPRPG
ncbi:FMN-binding glutamate synthase family protein [Engelhardtia mirabilis]|uniref:Ferredoxin-dependent glutamate synthase 1 n=1 Tax=Engelhardtia mirabilis TaxID=2528011 RepID=A0A518BMH1_9BACT|nr:Ferredoxin-dependent glutamate synthase 1 [Planctomycetes bacterium Pla133]QDV02506.1 Ferredoxin-dependent glutamate synthase 1 [Planctomycetes bacterium Pla86]